ncbi:MAG: glycosyltransferase family 1 protein [Flavobacterium sp.]|nr:MAG: glycosyltransferase family 1 protein [Flavobacterium sp.]
MQRLAIITTHPIQYNAPFFKRLAERGEIAIKVFYTWGVAVLTEKFDPGFGKSIEWDVPLLEGYEYVFVRNVSQNQGSHHFQGIDNPSLVDDINAWGATALLVYGWSLKSHLHALRYFKGKLPVYFRGDSTIIDVQSPVKKLSRFVLLSWVYRHIDTAFYTGTHNYNYYRNFLVKKERLKLMPHAVDNEFFSSDDSLHCKAAQEWRNQLGILPADIVFLFAGKLEEKKDPAILVKAFKTLISPTVHLVFAGDGPLENELKSTCEAIPNVHFVGFVNQMSMPTLYRLGDVFVLPSKGPGETWGLAINEAMASGRAIIASSKCGGAIDLVKEGENGFIFEAENSDDLSLRMKTLLATPGLINRFRKSSRERVKDFSLEHNCAILEKHMNC